MSITINVGSGNAEPMTVEQYEALALDRMNAGRCRVSSRVEPIVQMGRYASSAGQAVNLPPQFGMEAMLRNMHSEYSPLEIKINQAIGDIGKPGWLGSIAWWKNVDWKRTSRRERICGQALMYQAFYRASLNKGSSNDEARSCACGAANEFRQMMVRAGHPGDGLQ